MHFTSLPSQFGIGDLGPCAYEFADFLSAAGQKLWQVLPVNPTGYGDTPYQCFSAFAGNPLLISLERLRDRGLLQESDLDLAHAPPFPEDFVAFGQVIEFKMSALRRASAAFLPMLPMRITSPSSVFVRALVHGLMTMRSSWH